MICPKCQKDLNNLIDEGDKYCPLCGADIENAISNSFQNNNGHLPEDATLEDIPFTEEEQNAMQEENEEMVEDTLPESVTPIIPANNQEIVIERSPKREDNIPVEPLVKAKKPKKPAPTAESVVGIGTWLLFLIGMVIPIVNIVVFFVCLCSKKYASRKNFILAALVFMVILIITVGLLIVCGALLGSVLFKYIMEIPAVQEFIQTIKDYLTSIGLA